MNINRLLIIAGAILALSLGLLLVVLRAERSVPAPVVPEPTDTVMRLDPRNLSYTIAGETVTLIDGSASTPAAPGSALVVLTSYFGNELTIDVNRDGRDDTVFMLTQDGSGSGTFFYVAAALTTAEGYTGTEAVFIGDRIAPQNISAGPVAGSVIVNYADRAPGEPFTTAPSVGKSLLLKFNPETREWGELVADFEGESAVSTSTPVSVTVPPPVVVVDPAPTPALVGKTWRWVEASLGDGRTISPKQVDAFTLTLNQDGSFGMTTDCNGGGGTYTVKGDEIVFGDMMSTMMYCEGSQESDFQAMLRDTTSYALLATGELILNLKFDSGTVTFR